MKYLIYIHKLYNEKFCSLNNNFDFYYYIRNDPVLIIHRLGYSCKGDYMTHLINKINSTLNAYAECIESGDM